MAAGLLSGCAVWDFTQTKYQNATGFFNTYYNASKLFAEAETEIRKEKKLVDNTSITQLSVPGEDVDPLMNPAAPVMHGVVAPDGAVSTPSDAGEVPPSPDGARMRPPMQPGMGAPILSMTKQRGMQGVGVPATALENLDKVIAKCSRILVDYKKSKWVDNALLLIGKAYFYKQEYTKAERKFNELIDGFPESPLRAEAMLWLGKNSMMMDLFDDAEKQLNASIDEAARQDEPAVALQAYLSLGDMYLALRQSQKAVESYRKGTELQSTSDERVQLYLSLARELEKSGDRAGALDAYRALARSNGDRDVLFFAELNYARLAREMGRIDDAVNTLVDMLDNPTYIEYDGQLQMEIGRLYETVDEIPAAVDQYRYVDTTFRQRPESAEAAYALGKMYETKGKNYDKAFEYYSAARTAYPGIPASTLGGRRADQLGEYRKLRNRMFELDTLLFYVLYPDSLTARDSVRAIADSVARTELKQSGGSALSEDQRYQERISRRRPHGRNSGRINPSAPPTSGTLAVSPMGAGGVPQAPAGVQPLYRRVNLRTVPPDSVLRVLSISRMDVGWVLFDKVGDLDSAAYYYRLALDGSLPDTVLANALYTMAAIARRSGDTIQAREYEDRLITKLPETRFARTLMLARGMPVAKDSLTVYREAYERGATLLEQRATADGLASLERMRQNYPHSDESVRAQLAIAMVLEETPGKGDSALAIYRRMVLQHPASKYTQRAKDVLASIDRIKTDEAERIRKEEEKKREEELRKEREAKKVPQVVTHRDTTTLRFQRKHDPTKDEDFPLNLPEDKPKKQAVPDAPGKPGTQGDTPLPGASDPGAQPPQAPGTQPPSSGGDTDNQPLSVPLQQPVPPPPTQPPPGKGK